MGWRMPGQRGGEGQPAAAARWAARSFSSMVLRSGPRRPGWTCFCSLSAACHICAGTGPTPCHICAGTRLAPATSAPGPGSPLPHLHRDRAHPRLQLLQDWGHRCPHLPGIWLFPPPHRHPDSARPLRLNRPAPMPRAHALRPWQMRRSVVRQRRIAINRSLHGRSRAKLALAEALARLVRNPRDHASTSGGVVVERGPLRGRSRVRGGGPAYARACARNLHACTRALAYVRRHVCVRACVRARVRLRCGA